MGSTNAFGDPQLDVDIRTDEILFTHLRQSGVVHMATSEENPVEVPCGGHKYSVAFDPLDGSSIIDANFAVYYSDISWAVFTSHFVWSIGVRSLVSGRGKVFSTEQVYYF